MNKFWDNLIGPIIDKINANYIVEVGSDTGINTRNILKYCVDNDAHFTAIDPLPKFDIGEIKTEFGDKFEIYTELSLSVLPLLQDYDVILLDDDHNWYTVYHELKIIKKIFKDKKFPIVFLHDVGWPYARRDLYYNPENIPENYRQPFKKLGMYPGKNALMEKGGLNSNLYNAVYENNPKNGVLTAIEDFIDESNLEFSLKIVNAFNGLGILYQKNDEIEDIIENVITNSDLLDKIETDRIKLQIAHIESKEKNNLLQKDLDENKIFYKESKEKNNLLQKDLDENKILNDDLKEEIKGKDFLINSMKHQMNGNIKLINQFEIKEKKLKYQIENLTSRLLEMEYLNNNNRSITQRLVSKFPSLYILAKSNKTGLKNTLVNIKGYKAIKKNKMFDIGYYLKNNPDIRASGADPILHYMYHGFKEKRYPSPKFDGNDYLKRYPKIKNSKLNPLVHYSLFGLNEGKKIKPVNKNKERKIRKQKNKKLTKSKKK